ncbi:unnamed protein product [Calicophoron daubneyi]|uniref:Magnesium-dependent phosphatase 1 n=1 Tax=Calicophoron daubneyi TaxID=300641 RepID=A0AAV2TZD9_CALDB
MTYPKYQHFYFCPRMIHEDPRIKLACASRTEASKIANTILRLLDWEKFFDYKEIYPGSKTQHFKVFRELSGIPYEDMLFFDDEDRNTREISRLGVHCCLVPDGMSLDVFERALKQFSQTSN